MPRTRRVLADAQNGAPKTTPNGKRLREVNSIDAEDVGPAPGKKVKTAAGKLSYQYEIGNALTTGPIK